MNSPDTTVIITGGTIDSEWDAAQDTAVVAQESVVPRYFEKLKTGYNFSFNTVCMKDSRQLTPQDMEDICQAVDQSKDNKILITHGTYTMPDTARYLKLNMKTKKSVVLTGSAIPLRGYDMSDAPFNLGFALSTLENIEEVVKLVMNAQVFDPDEVAKNMSQASFFSLKQ